MTQTPIPNHIVVECQHLNPIAIRMLAQGVYDERCHRDAMNGPRRDWSQPQRDAYDRLVLREATLHAHADRLENA